MPRQIEYSFDGDTSALEEALRSLSSALDDLTGDAQDTAGEIEDSFGDMDVDVEGSVSLDASAAAEGVGDLQSQLTSVQQQASRTLSSISDLARGQGDLSTNIQQTISSTRGLGQALLQAGAAYVGTSQGAGRWADVLRSSAAATDAGQNTMSDYIDAARRFVDTTDDASAGVELLAMSLGKMGATSQQASGAIVRAFHEAGLETAELKARVANLPPKLFGAEASLEDLSDSSTQTAGTFGTLRRAAVGLVRSLGPVGVAVGAMAAALTAAAAAGGALAVRVSSLAQDIQNARAETGATAGELRGLQDVLEQLGQDADIATVARKLQRVGQSLDDAILKGGDAAKAFDEMGLSLESLADQTAVGALTDVIRATDDLSAAQRRQSFTQAFGARTARDLMAMTRMTSEEIDELASSHETAARLSESQRQELNRLAKTTSILSQDWDQFTRQLGADWAPVANETLRLLSQIQGTFTSVARVLNQQVVGAFESLINIITLDFQSAIETALRSLRAIKALQMGRGPDVAAAIFEGSATELDEEAAGFEQMLNDELRRLNEQFADAHVEVRLRTELDVLDEEGAIRQLLSAAEERLDAMIELDQRLSETDLSHQVEAAASIVRQLQQKLEDTGGSSTSVEISFDQRSTSLSESDPLRGAGPIPIPVQLDFSGIQDVGFRGAFESMQGMFDDGLSSISLYREQLKGLQRRLEALKQPTVDEQKLLNEINQELLDTSASFQIFSQAASNAAFSFGQDILSVFERLFQGPEKLTEKERAELRRRERDLNQSLAERRISQAEYSAQIAEITRKRTNEMKGEISSVGDVFKAVFKSIGSFVKNVMQQVVAEISRAVAMAASLKAVGSIFSLGGIGSFGSLFSGALGIGGGNLVGPGPASVQLQGQTRLSGQDLLISYNQTARSNGRL